MNARGTTTGRLLDAVKRERREVVLVAAIHAARGNVVQLARLLRCPRNKVYQGPVWLRPHLRREVYRARRGLRPLPLAAGARARLLALLGGALVECGGNTVRAAALLGVCTGTVRRHVGLYPELRALVERAARSRPVAGWLVRTCAVLSLAPMLEQVVAAAQGMSVEEIAAEIRASVHAGSCDPDQLAEAIAAVSVDAAGG